MKYGIVAWVGTNSTLIHQLQIIQSKIIRVMIFKCLKNCVKMTTLHNKYIKMNDIYELEAAKFTQGEAKNLPHFKVLLWQCCCS